MATNGYLLDLNDFKRTLVESLRSAEYAEVSAKYREYEWVILVGNGNEISVSISGQPPISLALAYEKFKADSDLHEAIYHRVMSIWR